jgi:hypothetical protein
MGTRKGQTRKTARKAYEPKKKPKKKKEKKKKLKPGFKGCVKIKKAGGGTRFAKVKVKANGQWKFLKGKCGKAIKKATRKRR